VVDMKHILLVTTIIFLILSVGCSANENPDITTKELMSKNDSSLVVIDIREEIEFSQYPKLKWAKHAPLSNFEPIFSSLGIQKEQTFYIICRTGNRSKRLQNYLTEQGYVNSVNVAGGMKAWTHN
jgi:rhodanese-related sulfurtransferase